MSVLNFIFVILGHQILIVCHSRVQRLHGKHERSAAKFTDILSWTSINITVYKIFNTSLYVIWGGHQVIWVRDFRLLIVLMSFILVTFSALPIEVISGTIISDFMIGMCNIIKVPSTVLGLFSKDCKWIEHFTWGCVCWWCEWVKEWIEQVFEMW